MGYVRLLQFTTNATQEMADALATLRRVRGGLPASCMSATTYMFECQCIYIYHVSSQGSLSQPCLASQMDFCGHGDLDWQAGCHDDDRVHMICCQNMLQRPLAAPDLAAAHSVTGAECRLPVASAAPAPPLLQHLVPCAQLSKPEEHVQCVHSCQAAASLQQGGSCTSAVQAAEGLGLKV